MSETTNQIDIRKKKKLQNLCKYFKTTRQNINTHIGNNTVEYFLAFLIVPPIVLAGGVAYTCLLVAELGANMELAAHEE